VYDATDPRSSLGSSTTTAPDPGTGIAAAQYVDIAVLPVAHTGPGGSATRVVRGQNLVLLYTDATAGDDVESGPLESEMAIVVGDDSPAFDVIADHGVTHVDGPGLVVVPPGSSRIVPAADGPLVRLVEVGETTWADRADNAEAYAQPHPRVAPLVPWPEPTGGRRVRVYPLADVVEEPGRFGRIFRTRSFMVNFLLPNDGPRDPGKLSPHTHEDFEQLSLALAGTFLHHIRTPWTGDSAQWRDDEHVELGSPSLAVIPPPTVHTTAATGSGRNVLIDIFSPPRTDFSAKPGWVLNDADYPKP
jgi:mannose-6-phosphate isomerase-like protein (cupin superfamily)